MTVTKEEDFLFSQIPRHRICAAWGSTGLIQEAEDASGKCGQEPLLWFPREGTSDSG